jgi:hypothetical protein|uniref:Uncharacterized protein n=1 Tax=Desulfobacca acetoxidans TaxID=60893 RepID=A0A7C3UXB9_9BACT
MEAFDSQGKIPPIGAADQGIVSKKIADQEGPGQGSRRPLPRKAATPQPAEEPEEPTVQAEHVIDIVV